MSAPNKQPPGAVDLWVAWRSSTPRQLLICRPPNPARTAVQPSGGLERLLWKSRRHSGRKRRSSPGRARVGWRRTAQLAKVSTERRVEVSQRRGVPTNGRDCPSMVGPWRHREPGFSLLWLNRSMTAAGGALDGCAKTAFSTVRTSGGRSYEMTRCTPSAGSTSVDFATGGFSLGTAPGSVSSRAQPEDRRNPHQWQLPPPLRRQRRRSRPPQLRHLLRQPPRSDGRRSRLTTTWAGARGAG